MGWGESAGDLPHKPPAGNTAVPDVYRAYGEKLSSKKVPKIIR